MRILTLTTAAAAALMMTACATNSPVSKTMETQDMACAAQSFNVFFDSGSSDFDMAGSKELDMIASAAQGCDIYRLELEGHADSVGTSPSNMSLSEKRAENVLSALSVRGVTADRIRIIPMGERETMMNESPNAWQRKVEVRMIP